MPKARRSPRSAIVKIAYLTDHPDECLVLSTRPGEKRLLRHDPETGNYYELVEHRGITEAERPILHNEAVSAAEEGEAEFRPLGYYRCSQSPEDRPGGNE